MLTAKQITYLQKINLLYPLIENKKAAAGTCSHCFYVNENKFSFCTNCGYPLHNKLLVDKYNNRLKRRKHLLFRAENAVLFARIILYIMASFMSLGIFFIFVESTQKYIIVLMALVLSGLFFFLAFWSQRNPFTALLTSFIILIVFSAINIFGKLVQSFTTLQGITSMLICLALLFIILKGVQGAYRINLIKQELQ